MVWMRATHFFISSALLQYSLPERAIPFGYCLCSLIGYSIMSPYDSDAHGGLNREEEEDSLEVEFLLRED